MKRTLTCLALAAFAASASAAVLTNVPMQGGMLMPEVWYHADTDTVTVDLSHILVTAQLTPLLVSNPNDSFSPDDPWFDALDPSRQGLAFSRRYGFDMHAMTDYLPYNRELWIRKLYGSPDLGIYDYHESTTPKAWTPIFGTAGTSNATVLERPDVARRRHRAARHQHLHRHVRSLCPRYRYGTRSSRVQFRAV